METRPALNIHHLCHDGTGLVLCRECATKCFSARTEERRLITMPLTGVRNCDVCNAPRRVHSLASLVQAQPDIGTQAEAHAIVQHAWYRHMAEVHEAGYLGSISNLFDELLLVDRRYFCDARPVIVIDGATDSFAFKVSALEVSASYRDAWEWRKELTRTPEHRFTHFTKPFTEE